MNKKRLVGWLQNLTLVALTASAVFLLTRLLLLHGSLPDRLQAALTAQTPLVSYPAETAQGSALRERFSSVHIMVTGDIAYGRYGQLYAASNDPLLEQAIPLFQEALGSATEIGTVPDGGFQSALETPGLYLDLTAPLPLAAVSVWLEADAWFDRSVRSMALTTERENAATLFLVDGEGSVFCYYTALPVSAVRVLCGSVAPNGGGFAYESGYRGLEPYSVLVAQAPVPADVEAALPAGYSAYNLLTALDFNAHTNYRYQETSSGVEVVEESPRTLRIGPDGTVAYSSGDTARTASGDIQKALEAACALAEALTGGTGATPLYLQSVREAEAGWLVDFRYQIDGIPVLFSDEGDALAVTVSGGSVISFVYRCRSYTPVEDDGHMSQQLLPPAMAAAIASRYPEGQVSIGYVDAGMGPISAQWLAE